MYEHRRFEGRPQDGQHEAEPGFLHHPWAVRVELEYDVAELVEVLVAHFFRDVGNGEVGDLPPVVAAAVQQAVADSADVTPLPEPLRVLGVGIGRDPFWPEIRAREVQQPGDA